jgi:hypothetical protein
LREITVPDKRIASYVKKYSTFLIDFCSQHVGFKKYPSKVLAASAVEVARKIVGVSPSWNSEFENLFHLR